MFLTSINLIFDVDLGAEVAVQGVLNFLENFEAYMAMPTKVDIWNVSNIPSQYFIFSTVHINQ